MAVTFCVLLLTVVVAFYIHLNTSASIFYVVTLPYCVGVTETHLDTLRGVDRQWTKALHISWNAIWWVVKWDFASALHRSNQLASCLRYYSSFPSSFIFYWIVFLFKQILLCVAHKLFFSMCLHSLVVLFFWYSFICPAMLALNLTHSSFHNIAGKYYELQQLLDSENFLSTCIAVVTNWTIPCCLNMCFM